MKKKQLWLDDKLHQYFLAQTECVMEIANKSPESNPFHIELVYLNLVIATKTIYERKH